MAYRTSLLLPQNPAGGAKGANHEAGSSPCRPSPLCAKPESGRTTEVSIPFRIPVVAQTAVLLTLSNVFMTFAWYAHLRNLATRPWFVAATASWGIAFFEYMLQVPGNRIGYTSMNLSQLKILQEVITLSVFVPFSLFYMGQPLRLDYLWAGCCIVGAVYFIFRG